MMCVRPWAVGAEMQAWLCVFYINDNNQVVHILDVHLRHPSMELKAPLVIYPMRETPVDYFRITVLTFQQCMTKEIRGLIVKKQVISTASNHAPAG